MRRNCPWLEQPRPHRQLRARFFVAPSGAVVEKAPTLTPRQRREVFERDGYRCRYCGASVAWITKSCSPFGDVEPGAVDHAFPRSRGGQNDPANLRLSCRRCNSSKQAVA